MKEQVEVTVISGNQKKDPSKTWEALSVKVGDWSTIIFPKSKFEMDYIKSILEAK